MESAQVQALYEPPLAAKPQLREKPHQGLPSKNQAWHQGPSVCNFTVTLGLRATVVENGVRQTYSARYYNPNTGRFMSRDPEDGDETDPKTLHKYVYANGDPVNAVDPTGRMAAEYALPLGIIAIPTTKVLLALGGTVGCLLLWEGGNVWANSVVASNGCLMRSWKTHGH
jgi:RHS repeat-associated protein